jgi:hypothetical protein
MNGLLDVSAATQRILITAANMFDGVIGHLLLLQGKDPRSKNRHV